MTSAEQVQSFEDNGYLIVRDFLAPKEVAALQSWAQEVHDHVPDEHADYMPYEEINAEGQRVLFRAENFADAHSDFNVLLNGDRLLGLLEGVAGEPMRLFKEKINYKLAGSGGFAPHIDAVAYTHIKDVKHLTILLSVDPSNLSNGGLEVVDGSQNLDIPVNKTTNCIGQEWCDKHTWMPFELEAGMS